MRNWYREEQLGHYEPGRNSWCFAPGDLVTFTGAEDETLGIILRAKWVRPGEKSYEIYEVEWSPECCDGAIPFPHEHIHVEVSPIEGTSRKLTFKWSPQ